MDLRIRKTSLRLRLRQTNRSRRAIPATVHFRTLATKWLMRSQSHSPSRSYSSTSSASQDLALRKSLQLSHIYASAYRVGISRTCLSVRVDLAVSFPRCVISTFLQRTFVWTPCSLCFSRIIRIWNIWSLTASTSSDSWPKTRVRSCARSLEGCACRLVSPEAKIERGGSQLGK